MQINMAQKEKEEEKKSNSFGRLVKSAFGFGSRQPENTYSIYIKKHKIDIIQIMECPICMLDFEPMD